MKRVSLLLLTFVYLVSCSGIAVKRFYCCGKLETVNVVYGAADDIANTSPKKNQSCCRHEQQNFKLKDAHFNNSVVSIDNPVIALLPQFNDWTPVQATNLFSVAIRHQSNVPPRGPDIPAYTLYCTYRI